MSPPRALVAFSGLCLVLSAAPVMSQDGDADPGWVTFEDGHTGETVRVPVADQADEPTGPAVEDPERAPQ